MSQQLREGTLTVLFTDLEGSTDLRNRIGDVAANDLMQAHAEVIRAQVQKHGGAEAKFLGDGFMILFDSAGQAVRCAIDIQRMIEQRNVVEQGEPIKVRIGLNTGDISRQADDIYGSAVNAAARICAKAQAGQILISQTVKELAGYLPDVRIVDRGLSWLKGFPSRWRLFEVLWQDKKDASAPVIRRGVDAPRSAPTSRRAAPMVARAAEIKVVVEELGVAHAGSVRAVALEGEAGIGKTRMLEHACELADRMEPPFWILRVAADEELRGPFFLFRTLFATPTVETFAEQASAVEEVERARRSISGNDASAGEALSGQERMLRVFDDASQAIRALARYRPVALLLDDLHWADVDSIRLIRYLVRTSEGTPLFMLFTLRPDSDASEGASANLVADLERMHVAQRIRLRRFNRNETAELLEAILGNPVAPAALDSLQARAEGVPFFIEEFGRAYREAGALQLVEGHWTMTQLSGPAVPVSVQSLIARRLAQLPADSRELLADAAILGRRFRLADLLKVLQSIGAGEGLSEWRLADSVEPAVDLGIIQELPEGSRYDYTFTHEQIQAALIESVSRQRKRRIHSAIADIMASGPEQHAAALSTMAQHALAAGDQSRGVAWAIQAAVQSFEAYAPEESLRIADLALKAAGTRDDRVALLKIKDDDLALLDRGEARLANLSELEALTAGVGDPAVEMDVKLRRSSALRTAGDYELASEVAAEVRQSARASSNRLLELRACLELGQALTRSPLGEAYWPLIEVDLEAASEPFEAALSLARELGDRAVEAAALRELGVLENGRVKLRVLSDLFSGSRPREAIFNMLQQRYFDRAKELIGQALKIYEETGDTRGVTSSLIALAYSHAPEGGRRGEAGRIEQVRRLQGSLKRLVSESQRKAEDAEMLYSIHVFARAHVYPDLALERGREAFEAARSIGDKKLEFMSAGGMALTHLSLAQTVEARAWLDRAAVPAASLVPPLFSRKLEAWLGMVDSADLRFDEAVRHLEAAATAAEERGSPAGRCEALALVALEMAKMGASGGPEWLLERAAQAADEAHRAARTLPGNLAWEAQAWAAKALVAHVEKDSEKASNAARASLAILEPRFKRELYLDVLWIAAKTLILTGEPEGPDLAQEIRENLEVIDRSTVAQEVKDTWFSVPMHAELAEIAGYSRAEDEISAGTGLDDHEIELLGLVTSGFTDAEIAETLGTPPELIDKQLGELFHKLGVSGRTAAKEFALKAGVA